MNRILLATHNKDKVEEIRTLLADLRLEILTLDGFPQVKEIAEDGQTLEENALKKAREVFRLTGLPSLADDTGLEVHYLNKEPGVYSARYSGPNASYADNRKKLLESMTGVPPRRRGARFRAVMAFVAPGNIEHVAEGICHGTITEVACGTHGFGYDPIFIPSGHTQTFAEMDPKTKNRLSHRYKAIENITPDLKRYFNRDH